MKIDFQKIKPYLEKVKIQYQKRWVKYLIISLAGILLISAGIFIGRYGVRRIFRISNPAVVKNVSYLKSKYDAKLLVDEKVFVEKISVLFDSKTVFDTYRQGLHSFRLMVFVNSSNKVVNHYFRWWNGTNYIDANNFIDSLRFQQVLNTIPFSNGDLDHHNDYNGSIEFQLRIGLNKDGKTIQPLEVYNNNDRWSTYPLGKYITKNEILNRKGVYVDLSNDEINQYTYRKKNTKPDTPPVPLNHTKVFDEKLTYPEKAKEMELQGRVVLRVLVNESGNVVAVSIDQGLGGGCDEAAVKAAFDVKYKPALLNGKPTKSSAVLPVIFRL